METTEYNSRLRDAIRDKQVIVLATPAVRYDHWILASCRVLSDMFGRICFVSLLKSYKVWLQEFESFRDSDGGAIRKNRFFFVDGVANVYKFPGEVTLMGYMMRPKIAVEDLLYSMTTKHRYLYTLTDNNKVNQRILSTVWDMHSQALVIDALPILSQYMGADDIVRMMHVMTSRLRSFKCKLVLPFTIDERSGELLKQIQILVDDIVVVK